MADASHVCQLMQLAGHAAAGSIGIYGKWGGFRQSVKSDPGTAAGNCLNAHCVLALSRVYYTTSCDHNTAELLSGTA